jgi:hypothetical protein
MREIRYYLRSNDDHKKPLVTVVTIKDPVANKFYRGVAICSPLDIPNKKTGYNKAKGRALMAQRKYWTTITQNTQLSDEPINRLEAYSVINSTDSAGIRGNIKAYGKASVLEMGQLNELERKLFEDRII